MSSQSSEVIHCPNCKEDVPKTLYCLNCGYPLYKLEQQKIIEEPAQESVTEPEEEVDMSVGIEPQEPTPEPVIEPEPEPEEESILEPEMEPEIATAITVEEEPEPIEEESTPEPEDVYIEPAEEYEEPEPEQVFEPEVKTDIFTPEERESYMMDEIKIEFAPDPLTKDVMESLAKNITLKIRLVRLLRESQVKEETFKKLFDSYVDQGRLWVGRRDEIVRRFKADILRMEQEIISARKDHELLEIRKNIGDASEEEYNVKAPAYKWDIENLDKEIKITRGSIQYVINLKGLIPDEEVEELIQMAESDYSELDDIESVTSDTIARMKETLAEAVNSLES
ncbi:hypothetical protein IH574_03490 [Candidatus Bathyarchaeota archaeon]|nr:hypothetical protein [Candidatus Bathyarchaeota archaeon]